MLKVLVVEDEELIRKGIILTVDWASLDCVVVGEAANGEEALEAVERFRPSLIITDLKMPRMDGITMLERLEKLLPDSVAIFMSGYSDKEIKEMLSVAKIFEYATTVDLSLLDKIRLSIDVNSAISDEGMNHPYGLCIGRGILDDMQKGYRGDSLTTYAMQLASAGADARMAGADAPVVSNSGSGNQGIACTMPVVAVAKKLGVSDEQMMRAVTLSNLMGIYIKSQFGRLSAFCGAVSASCAAGAAITYMVGGDISLIKKTIENTLANIPGIICDGAKISCAAKIAACLDAAFLAHHLAMNGQSYAPYTGILQEETAETISCVGQIGKDGMKETDREILKIMLEH